MPTPTTEERLANLEATAEGILKVLARLLTVIEKLKAQGAK